MKELKVINEQKVLGNDFKIYGDFENPLFLAKDVAEWIGHSKASVMLDSIDEDEKLRETIFTSGQNREMWFVTEQGLYEILMQSRKPIAKEFKKQVKAILKEIRQTGSYTKPMTQTEILAQSVQCLVEIEKRVQDTENKLDSVIDIFTNSVSSDKWKEETNRKLDELCKYMKKPYQTLRGEFYKELEILANCNISARQRNLKARLEKCGATYQERKATSKIDVIARDEKLKLVFDGIIRKYQAWYIIKKY